MTATELGLLLSEIAAVGCKNNFIADKVMRTILLKAASILMVDGSTHRYDLNLTTPRYTQVELDLMEDWREVSPEEIFANFDEHELHKMGYSIPYDDM
jgi:hypothetical protein